MLSEQGKLGLARAFDRAAKAGLLRGTDDRIEIAPAVLAPPAGQPGERVFVITASSFVFRLMTIFHVPATPASRRYYRSEHCTDEELGEALAEIVNLCGGALNRELSRHFPHLAMSIPYSLNAECLRYVQQMKPEYVSSFSITINGAIQVRATLCLSSSAPVDIPMTASEVEDHTGELELF